MPLLSCPCAHRRPQVSAGLHDPLHHLLCRLSRGLRVPALHHGERKPLLPLGGRHAGVLWVSQGRTSVCTGEGFTWIWPGVLLQLEQTSTWLRETALYSFLLWFFALFLRTPIAAWNKKPYLFQCLNLVLLASYQVAGACPSVALVYKTLEEGRQVGVLAKTKPLPQCMKPLPFSFCWQSSQIHAVWKVEGHVLLHPRAACLYALGSRWESWVVDTRFWVVLCTCSHTNQCIWESPDTSNLSTQPSSLVQGKPTELLFGAKHQISFSRCWWGK